MKDTRPAKGHGRQLCGAAKRQGGGHCKKPAGWGTPHPGRGRCRLHGGSTRSQSRRAAEQEIEDRASAILADLGAPPVENALVELQRLAGRALALENAIGQMVNELGSLRYESKTGGGEQLRAEVAVLERAMDRCGRLLVDIAKLNIDERIVQINARVSEEQGHLVFEAVMGAFTDIGLGDDMQYAAREAIARRLRLAVAEERRLELESG
jgi:hypothetical protein